MKFKEINKNNTKIGRSKWLFLAILLVSIGVFIGPAEGQRRYGYSPSEIADLLSEPLRSMDPKAITQLSGRLSSMSPISSNLTNTALEASLNERINIGFALFKGLGHVLKQPFPSSNPNLPLALETLSEAYHLFLERSIPYGHLLMAYTYLFQNGQARIVLDPDIGETPYLAPFQNPQLKPQFLGFAIRGLNSVISQLNQLVAIKYHTESHTDQLMAATLLNSGEGPFFLLLMSVMQSSSLKTILTQDTLSQKDKAALSQLSQSYELAMTLPGLFELLTLDTTMAPQLIRMKTKSRICLTDGKTVISDILMDDALSTLDILKATHYLFVYPEALDHPWSSLKRTNFQTVLDDLTRKFIEANVTTLTELSPKQPKLGHFSPKSLHTLLTLMTVTYGSSASINSNLTKFRKPLKKLKKFLNTQASKFDFMPETWSGSWLELISYFTIELLKGHMAHAYGHFLTHTTQSKALDTLPLNSLLLEASESQTTWALPDKAASLPRLLALLVDQTPDELDAYDTDPWHSLLSSTVKQHWKTFLGSNVMGKVFKKLYAKGVVDTTIPNNSSALIDLTLNVSRYIESDFAKTFLAYLEANQNLKQQSLTLPTLPDINTTLTMPKTRSAIEASDRSSIPIDHDSEFSLTLSATGACQSGVVSPRALPTETFLKETLPETSTYGDALITLFETFKNTQLPISATLRSDTYGALLATPAFKTLLAPETGDPSPHTKLIEAVLNQSDLKKAWTNRSEDRPLIFEAYLQPLYGFSFPSWMNQGLQTIFKDFDLLGSKKALQKSGLITDDDIKRLDALLKSPHGMWFFDSKSVYMFGTLMRVWLYKNIPDAERLLPKLLQSHALVADLQMHALLKRLLPLIDALEGHPELEKGLAWLLSSFEGPLFTTALFYEHVVGEGDTTQGGNSNLKVDLDTLIGNATLSAPNRQTTFSMNTFSQRLFSEHLNRWVSRFHHHLHRAEPLFTLISKKWMNYVKTHHHRDPINSKEGVYTLTHSNPQTLKKAKIFFKTFAPLVNVSETHATVSFVEGGVQ